MSDSNNDNPGDVNGKNPFYRPGKKQIKPFSPEEGCLTFIVGASLLLISLAFWGWYYWQNNPEFHPERKTPPRTSPDARTKRATPGLNP